MRFKSTLLAICGVALAWSAWAHHSHGAYVDTFMDIQGVVKEVHLVVPHSWIYLEVKDDKGEPQVWALEATGRTGLQKGRNHSRLPQTGRHGQTRCHRLRDGCNGCLPGFLKAKDGTVKDWDGNNAPPPDDF